MRTVLMLLVLYPILPAYAEKSAERVVIHLLDPRGAISGEETMSIQWRGGTADVIATRLLNIAEAKKLRILLRKELADDTNVPFCGHRPAYAVATTPAGKTTTTVTLCGSCFTWAQGGNLRALHGKVSLQYLDSLLPLPEVFRTIDGDPAEMLNPFFDGEQIPFDQLDNAIGGSP